MFEYEVSGKTINKAIENGLEDLKLTKDDVDIRVLQDAGLFKKAKILLIISDEIAENNEAIKNIKKLKSLEEKVLQEEKEKIENKIQTSETFENLTINENTSHVEIVKNYLSNLISKAGFSATVETKENEDTIFVYINGEKMGTFIGYQGSCLTSLQYLANIYMNKISRKSKRIIIDINNYKEKRKETLESLAHRLAKRIQETEKRMELEPMNSYERLVIHNIISKYPELKSHSEGVEPNRYLIIELNRD